MNKVIHLIEALCQFDHLHSGKIVDEATQTVPQQTAPCRTGNVLTHNLEMRDFFKIGFLVTNSLISLHVVAK